MSRSERYGPVRGAPMAESDAGAATLVAPASPIEDIERGPTAGRGLLGTGPSRWAPALALGSRRPGRLPLLAAGLPLLAAGSRAS